jgi:hypothetical protein
LLLPFLQRHKRSSEFEVHLEGLTKLFILLDGWRLSNCECFYLWQLLGMK